jgi:phosphoribosyl 1,2-cyclic phosphodiesterase
MYFRQCHAAFLESNYDEDMLMNGSYPDRLKKRISNGKGHLSNSQALDLFRKHRSSFMTHLVLSHLSQNNNHPDIVNRLFNGYAGDTEIFVASRNEESPVFHVKPGITDISATPSPLLFYSQQLSLF